MALGKDIGIMPKFRVHGTVGISVSTEVESDTPQNARVIALGRLCGSVHDAGDALECWVTNGDLDGEPEVVSVEYIHADV